jgi:hypothetical protein
MAKTKSKTTTKKKSSDTKKTQLSPRELKQEVYNQKRLEGHSKFESGVAAGFSESVSRNAGEKIEDERQMSRLRQLVAERNLEEKAVQVMDDSLAAEDTVVTKTKREFWTKDGKASEEKVVLTEVPNHSVRLKAAELVAKVVRAIGGGEGADINNYGPTQFIIDL